MKSRTFAIFLFILFMIASFLSNAIANPTVAFGYLSNESNKKSYNYLEIIFPNSFASSIHAIFNVHVKKPLQIKKELKKRNLTLKKYYEVFELPDLVDKIDADLFIFGSFRPLPNNQIKITLNIYMEGYNEIFKFTNIGRMETEISKLVDRITIIVINFMDQDNLYRIKKILPGTRLAILTNLEGEEQNRLLITLLKKGYYISCVQNNTIYNMIDDSEFERFKFIRTRHNSYDTITDWRKTKFYHSSWVGIKYNQAVKYIKSIYNKYDLNYIDVKDIALENLYSSFKRRIDFLLIVGFSNSRRKSWIRAIDIREKDLIWMQSNIKSDLLTRDPITNITQKIVNAMTKDIKDPFKTSY